MNPIFTPFERERRFIEKLNIRQIQRALWPLLTVFVLLSFSDVITTVVAAARPGFDELNPLGARLFGLGFAGFMTAYVLKFVPIVPLFYISALRNPVGSDEFQVRLLKAMAFVVLLVADTLYGVIVLGNNLPQLLNYFRF